MSIARSGVVWFLASVLGLGVTWLANLFFARALTNPQEVLGAYYVFESIVAFLYLVTNAGTTGALVKRISEGQDIGTYVGSGVTLTTVLAGVVTLFVAVFSDHVVAFFGVGQVSLVFLIGMLWATWMANLGRAVLSGNSNVGRAGILDLVQSIGQVSAQISLVLAGFGLVGLMGGALLGVIVAGIIGGAVVASNIACPARRHLMHVVSYAKYQFVTGFTVKFYDNIDILVISALIGKSATGVYGIGFRFSLIVKVFSEAVGEAGFPEISRLNAIEDQKRVTRLFDEALVYSTLLAIPAFVGVAILARPLIVTFYTPSFADSAAIAVVAVAIQIPDGFRYVFSATLGGLDRPELNLRGGIVLVVANLALDLVLVPTVGPIGAVYASLIGVCLQTTYLGYHTLETLNLSWTSLPLQLLAAEAIAAVTMGGIVVGLRSILSFPPVPELTILVSVGGLSYFIILLGGSREMRERVTALVKGLLPAG